VLAKKSVKKKKAALRKTAARTTASERSVESYLARIAEAARPTFLRLREVVRAAVPLDAEEVISYGILAFRRERVVVWIAAFRKHVSLFPTAEVLAAFEPELKGFSTSKGTVQFPLDRPLPLALITKMLKHRIELSKNAKRRGGGISSAITPLARQTKRRAAWARLGPSDLQSP
jgi:uncharacterized protein YdhG (YjbR/CyaY superfamily)